MLSNSFSNNLYRPAHADQPSALVLPLALPLKRLGCSTEADGQAAGGIGDSGTAAA